jgi:ABC-type multidrug transport system ATPase subunit
MCVVRPSMSDDDMVRALAGIGFEDARELLHRAIGTLSSGQRRRVQLARALALGRRVLILDEPEAGLDAATLTLVKDALVRLSRETLVVIATHSRAFDEGLVLAPRHVVEEPPAARAS